MSFNISRIYRKFILFLLGGLSFGGLVSGLMLCLLESPETTAHKYLSLVNNSNQQAVSLTLTALSYTPYDDAAWEKLNELKTKNKVLVKLEKLQPEKLQNFAFNNLD